MATLLRVVWFWGKVALVLVLIDVLLFRVGWFWELERAQGQRERLHRAAGDLATHDAETPLAIAVGSSVVRRTAPEDRINRSLERSGADTQFINLGVDAAHTDEAALMLHVASDAKPWLVIYGVALRDFTPRTGKSFVQRAFIDSTFDVPTMQPASVDQRLSWFVRSHWRLYHYRRFVRAVLNQMRAKLAASFPAAASAREPPRFSGQPRSLVAPEFMATPAWPFWLRWQKSQAFADYEKYLAARGALLKLYRGRRAMPFDLGSSPQLASFEWMLRRAKEIGARMIVAYFPENPAFRDPAAAEYFDPELSDELAAILEREAARYGARFVDLRSALPADHFVDLLHPNRGGRRKVARLLSRIIDQESRLAVSSVATTGSIR